jgi:uncharacterized protein (TIGR00288 family)
MAAVTERNTMSDQAHSLAVFIDYENLALGTGPRGGKGKRKPAIVPDMGMVLERLVEKGKVVVKRAYSDWHRFPDAVEPLHELGIELTEIPDRRNTGKNCADIRLVVDAMEMCHAKEHIDAFVIVSGDSDFTPLVLKLKENGKEVIGVGLREATSDILAANCDEFIFYEDIASPSGAPVLDKVPEEKRPAFKLLFETMEAVQREGGDRMHASLLKIMMRRKQPQFNESTYGYRNFTKFLQDAESMGLIALHKDAKSDTWVEGVSN